MIAKHSLIYRTVAAPPKVSPSPRSSERAPNAQRSCCRSPDRSCSQHCSALAQASDSRVRCRLARQAYEFVPPRSDLSLGRSMQLLAKLSTIAEPPRGGGRVVRGSPERGVGVAPRVEPDRTDDKQDPPAAAYAYARIPARWPGKRWPPARCRRHPPPRPNRHPPSPQPPYLPALHRSRELTHLCSPKRTHPLPPSASVLECSGPSRFRVLRAPAAPPLTRPVRSKPWLLRGNRLV